VAAVPPSGRGQAFGLAQSGILAGQGLAILIGGAAAQVLGPEAVVALAGVLGLSVAAMLTLVWNQIRAEVIVAMHERPAGDEGAAAPADDAGAAGSDAERTLPAPVPADGRSRPGMDDAEGGRPAAVRPTA